jgi:hypothetical protein
MVMRYFGGGIGHLKNTPPQQLEVPIDPSDEEMAVDEEDNNVDPCIHTNEDLGNIVPQPSIDVIMISDELEVTEDDEDDNEDDNLNESDNSDDGDESGDDKDDDSGCSSESDEEDYGYATP